MPNLKGEIWCRYSDVVGPFKRHMRFLLGLIAASLPLPHERGNPARESASRSSIRVTSCSVDIGTVGALGASK